MSESNIAIVFGPTLLRPRKETMETTLDSPLVNQAVQRLIEVKKTTIPSILTFPLQNVRTLFP